MNEDQILVPEPSPGPEPVDPTAGMSLMEHLEELRSRLIKMALAFVVGAVVSWFLYNQILAVLIAPLARLPVAEAIIENGKLIFTAPTEAFFVRLKVVSFAGLALALPVILWQLWRFVAPGLHAHEKKYSFPFVLISLALFAGGAAFAFWTLPRALEILTQFAGDDLVLLPRASEYLSFVMLLVAAFGLAFEFPLVLIALSVVGVVSADTLRRGRRIAWIVILVVAAIITPTQDPVTLMLMAGPLALLYEATILVVRLIRRRRTPRSVG
jgi:sec-independent protein translocase protein TatC